MGSAAASRRGLAPREPEGDKVRRWLLGARPRTLPAALVPVALGAAVARWDEPGHVALGRAGLALVVALAIQVGVNYANDYSDGVRGTDEKRAGPLRLVASGLASPRAVRNAALAAFAVAGVAGLLLAAETSWWLLAAGAASFAAGWLYTGGPKPYGYLGLGEVFVFAFFGIVATVGTVYVTIGRFPWIGLIAGSTAGLLAVALLEANNVRDISSDAAAGKRTLAVRLGRRRAGQLFAGTLAASLLAVIAIGIAWAPWALLSLLATPLAGRPLRFALGGAEGRKLLPMLAGTAALQLFAGLLLAVGISVR
jgi:1,4-dihydroxy-2-naphthoate octaprenyltransferase